MVILCYFLFALISINGQAEETTGIDAENKKDKPIADGLDLPSLAADAIDWAQNAGIKMRVKGKLTSSDVASFVPLTLFPTPYPRQLFEAAYNVEEAMMTLYFRVASDYEFLSNSLTELAEQDETVRKLLGIYQQSQQGTIQQPNGLMLMRSDYFCHLNEKDEPELKQIEVNIGTIGGYNIEQLPKLHERMLAKAGMPASVDRLPVNNMQDTSAEGLYQAWLKFGNPEAALLIVINAGGDPFHSDEPLIQYKLEELSNGRMKVFMLTIMECYRRLKLADDFSLHLEDYVVGLVWYRVTRAQSPRMLTEEKLDIWLKIEKSTAIKSPTLGMELASMKKIQQILAQPGTVEQFFPDPKDAEKVAAIRRTYAGLWGLEGEDAESLIEDAIEHPDRYVLKPNREGGGYNFWDDKMVEKLRKLDPKERGQFILMQRLRPMVHPNYVLRPNADVQCQLENVVAELGMMGYLLGDASAKTVHGTRTGGHLIRTKMSESREGGLTIGAGSYDSPFLY